MIDRFRRHAARRLPTAATLLVALALGACQTGGGNSPVASTGISSGSKAIAFESIDGPPEPVFDKLVASLGTEASARQIRVVSRQSDAPYRVRGYLATTIENGKNTVDYVWDVFDANQERVLRVAGVEKLESGKDVWNKVDDATLTRIASASLEQIGARLATGTAPRPAAASDPAPTEEPGSAPAIRLDDGPPIASTEPAAQPDADEPAAAIAQAAQVPSSTLTFAAHP